QVRAAKECIARAGVQPAQIAAIGIANQRETTLVWDAETGKVDRVREAVVQDGRLSIRHTFAPYGSAIFLIHPQHAEDTPAQTSSRHVINRARSRRELLALPDEWHFEVENPNALPLADLHMYIRTHGGGTDYTWTAPFQCDRVPGKLLLMLDDVEYRSSLMGGMDLTIQVNGDAWHNPEFGWYLDRGFKTLDISHALRPGENKLTITIRHSAWSGQPHLLNSPPILLGDFAVDAKTTAILPAVRWARAGSWTDFGYAYYSGTAAYSQSFVLPDFRAGARLIVTVDDVRDAVEIAMNGKTADVRLWQPWEAEVTDLVMPGENRLTLKVTNSMANLFELRPQPSGLMGRVRLVEEE
ncbi:MAG: glycosylhydrolase-like jelly roll fold domain-containing protein, partial [Armatimonadota bacterium]